MRPEELPHTLNGATIYDWAEKARRLKALLEEAWEAERVATVERDAAREEVEMLKAQLEHDEDKLSSLTR